MNKSTVKDAEKPVKPVCKSFEGCHGDGWIYDLSDSGSGRTCYCDCQAGTALQAKEDAQDLPINPIYGTGL